MHINNNNHFCVLKIIQYFLFHIHLSNYYSHSRVRWAELMELDTIISAFSISRGD